VPNPHPIELRERAVRAYLAGGGTMAEIAERFAIGHRTMQTLVARWRSMGTLEPTAKGGGNPSPIDLSVLDAVLRDRPDAVTGELTLAYNSRVGRTRRVHRSSILRALRRQGYVFKKNVRGPQSKTGPTSKKRDGGS
jgi:transposase